VRFLADAGISPKTVEFLRKAGHDVAHVRDYGMQRAPDREVIERAQAESRVLLTFDLDFGEILALGVLRHPSVVLFRLAKETSAAVNLRLAAVLAAQSSALDGGALVLVEDSRYRLRKLPIVRG
jgi:predicted nuclease of predicted toxin-antitoxin system